jgi:hypothetical protein
MRFVDVQVNLNVAETPEKSIKKGLAPLPHRHAQI